jgi:hypothetical protein
MSRQVEHLRSVDGFEGAIKGPDHHAGARRDSGDHGEELTLSMELQKLPTKR